MSATTKKASDFKRELEKELGKLPRILDEMVNHTITLETLTSDDEEEEPMPPGENRKGKPRPDFGKKGAYFRKAVDLQSFKSGKVRATIKELMNYIDKLEAKLP